MQREGKPQFLHAHSGIVQGVSFNPKDRYIFCSGATDGQINIYNALQGLLIKSVKLNMQAGLKNINAVRYNADGSRILTATSKRLSVLDPEASKSYCTYDNCTYLGKDRAPLAPDPNDPNLVVCAGTQGNGLVFIDLRKSQMVKFFANEHTSIIRDIIHLDKSWPYLNNQISKVASISFDGICKIRTDSMTVDHFDVDHQAYCLTATPDKYMGPEYGDDFVSLLMVGGDNLTGYKSGHHHAKFTYDHYLDAPVSRIKYTSNGHFLYAASTSGKVLRYRRVGTNHKLLDHVYSHSDEIIDMDISPTDEYLVTASRDGQVGLLCLGLPSHGCTGYMEIA